MTTVTRIGRIGAATRSTSLPDGMDELLIRDKDLTGFVLRIRKDSVRYVMAGRVAGTDVRRTVTLGDADSMTAVEARAAAMRVRNEMRAGADPKPKRGDPGAAVTFEELADRWLRLWAAGKTARGRVPRPASVTDARSSLMRAKAHFGQSLVADIDSARLRRFRAAVLAEDVSGSAKRKALGVLGQVLDFAEETGVIDTSPARGATLPAPSPARDRWLSAQELAAVWGAAEKLGRAGDVLRLLCALPVRVSIATGLDRTPTSFLPPCERAQPTRPEAFAAGVEKGGIT